MTNIEIVEEDLNYRLKQVIKQHYENQKEFAKVIGISQSIVTGWWADRSKPRTETLQKICEDTGVSMDWLVLGRAEPYVDEDLFQDIFDESKKFADENDIPFNAMYLLGMQRIVISELKHNKNITLTQIFTKYKDIIIAFRK